MISILDYDMANLRSVQKAFEHFGVSARVISTPAEVEAADRLVLPGVGSFADAVRTLRERGIVDPIRRHAEREKPLLGICLGLQILFDVGYEDGEHRGLEVLRGKCVRFDVDAKAGLKVPHMGWNSLDVRQESPLLNGLEPGSNVYFVHSYHVVPADDAVISTTTDYGGPFVSSIRQGNLMATQFHPEKSQGVGLKMLQNFAAL